MLITLACAFTTPDCLSEDLFGVWEHPQIFFKRKMEVNIGKFSTSLVSCWCDKGTHVPFLSIAQPMCSIRERFCKDDSASILLSGNGVPEVDEGLRQDLLGLGAFQHRLHNFAQPLT